MKCLVAVAAALLLAACVSAPLRPQPPKPQAQQQHAALEAELAREREARRLAEVQRELAAAERRRAEARQPLAGKITLSPHIAAQPLEPMPEQPPETAPATPPQSVLESLPKAAPRAAAEPAKIDAAAFAWQLSTDLRMLHSQAEVQTFYSDDGWVVSLAAEALFEPDETSIRPDAGDTVDSLARVLRHYAARGIVMQGPHKDRAQAVKRALAQRGIAESAITANGTGERVEFLVPHAHLNAATGR